MDTKDKILLLLCSLGLNIFGWALGFNLYDKIKPNPELFDIIEYGLLGTGWLLFIVVVIIQMRKRK